MKPGKNSLNDAVSQFRNGNLAGAEAVCRQILGRHPLEPDASNLLAVICRRNRRFEEAVRLLDVALSVRPLFAPYHLNRGLVLIDMGRPQEAADALRRCLALNGTLAEAHAGLAEALSSLGDRANACRHLETACRLAPQSASLANQLGIALRLEGRNDEAVQAYRRAICLDSRMSDPHSNLAELLLEQNQKSEAETAVRAALARRPDHPEALNNLGNVLKAKGLGADALDVYHRAMALRPNFAEAMFNSGNALLVQGRPAEAITWFRRALKAAPLLASCHSTLAFAYNYLPGSQPSEILREHVGWAQAQAGGRAIVAATTHPNDRSAERPLRVGYVSPDFHRHPVGYFLEPVLAQHNRARVEAVCYSTASQADEITERMRAQTVLWREAARLSDAALADQVRADRVDILVDLAGHTGGNSLLAFARKPAPIQMTWMGYVNTTGLAAMDYILTDAYQTPVDSPQRYTETVLRMPHGYVCYRPQENAPAVGPLPALAGRAGQGVTFGCFNNLAKINEQVINVWAEILLAVPRSRLLVMTHSLADPRIRERFRAPMLARGVEAACICLQPAAPSFELLNWYNEVDLALDPFPYVGGLTTIEAMWMGVPTVTLAGTGIAGRHSVSHLSNSGLGDFVTERVEDYIALAVRWAGDLEALAALRSGLRARVAAGPLLDWAGFTRNLEDTYRSMWHRWCST